MSLHRHIGTTIFRKIENSEHMRVFVQCCITGLPFNETVFNAYDGFREMGFEIIFFQRFSELTDLERTDIVVGGLGPTKMALQKLECLYPELDYPDELHSYLGRKIWKDKINHINSNPELWPVFVKPYVDKKFTGRVVREPKDLIGCGEWFDNQDVICSEVVEFEAEWRCFVKYGEILDVRPYKGSWKCNYDPSVIESCVKDYKTIPAGCALDFGVTKDGRTLLVEVNDGFSIGSYGLMSINYAKLLSARWSELTGTEDETDFEGKKKYWHRKLFSKMD